MVIKYRNWQHISCDAVNYSIWKEFVFFWAPFILFVFLKTMSDSCYTSRCSSRLEFWMFCLACLYSQFTELYRVMQLQIAGQITCIGPSGWYFVKTYRTSRSIKASWVTWNKITVVPYIRSSIPLMMKAGFLLTLSLNICFNIYRSTCHSSHHRPFCYKYGRILFKAIILMGFTL